MTKNRLEAFSDGVIAIIITIMVLELAVPHGEGFTALTPLVPVFFSYVLSFVYLGIYWNNHHHMLHTVEKINGPILWANLHLLFWLSLIPFATGWMGENHFAAAPSALYGIVLLMCAIAYYSCSRSSSRLRVPIRFCSARLEGTGKVKSHRSCISWRFSPHFGRSGSRRRFTSPLR